MTRTGEPIPERYGRTTHKVEPGLLFVADCDKNKGAHVATNNVGEIFEQKAPVHMHNSTPPALRKVEPDQTSPRYADARIPIDQAASRLGIVVTKGKFLCPSHDDHDPSASIDSDGVHWKCFSCGVGGSAIDLVMAVRQCDMGTAVNEIIGYNGLSSKAAKAKQPSRKPKIDYKANPGFETFEACLGSYQQYAAEQREADPTRHVVYDFTPTYKRVRFFHRDTGKKIGPIPFEVHRNGRWYAFQNDADPKRLLPLYGGSRLATIGPLVSQVIVEGEKKADIINAMTSETFPLVAVASANGGSAFAGTDWTQLRGDRKIILWPDDDATGAEFAKGVAKIVLSSGKWNNVSVVRDAMPVDDLLEGRDGDHAATVFEFLEIHAHRVRSSTMAEIRDQITRYMALLPNEPLSLIVVDTGDDYLSEKSQGNNDGSVKSDLNHLRELAEDTGAAVVFIKHFSKAKCRLRDRIMGSAAWTNKPRQTIVIAKDPAAGPDDVMIGIAKSNVGREGVAIGYMRLRRQGQGIIPSVTITTTDDEYSAIEARIIEAETGGRSSSIKTWPNDQIITWIIRTIRESDNGEISGIDLDERSQVAEIPVNRFMAVRKNLKDNGQIAQTNARHGPIKWFIPKGD
jgi:hypothetical protein